jgi:hypothetical protein
VSPLPAGRSLREFAEWVFARCVSMPASWCGELKQGRNSAIASASAGRNSRSDS